MNNADKNTEDGEPLQKKAKPASKETVTAETSKEENAKPVEQIEKVEEEPLAKKAKTAIEEPVTAKKSKEEDAKPVDQIEKVDEEPKSRIFRLLREDEDPVPDGIQAKNPKALKELRSHVLCGSTNKSQYISCSERLRGAIELGKQNLRSDLIRIAVIDSKLLAQTNGIMIYDLKTLIQCLETGISDDISIIYDKKTAVQYAKRFYEVIIEGNIGKECIVAVFQAERVQNNYWPPVSLYVKDGCLEESEMIKAEIHSLLGCILPPEDVPSVQQSQENQEIPTGP